MISCFILNNNLVIIIMHIYIIIISVSLFIILKNSNELFLNASDLILPIAIVYVVGVAQWPKCVLPLSVTSHENEGLLCASTVHNIYIVIIVAVCIL